MIVKFLQRSHNIHIIVLKVDAEQRYFDWLIRKLKAAAELRFFDQTTNKSELVLSKLIASMHQTDYPMYHYKRSNGPFKWVRVDDNLNKAKRKLFEHQRTVSLM
jgi:hypothetical protein